MTQDLQIVAFIPNWRPCTLNSLLAVSHWTRSAMKEADAWQVLAAFTGKPKSTGKRRVDVQIALAGRWKEADPDAYWKSLLDALVKCGQLVDDRREFCELGEVTYVRDCAERGTKITLTERN